MVQGISLSTNKPTHGLDDVTRSSIGTGNFHTAHLVDGDPQVEALTSDKAGKDFICEFGGQAAKDALADIENSDMSPEEKDAAIENLAEDVRAGHLAKGVLTGNKDFKDFVGPKGAEIYDRAIANRLPANSHVPVPRELTDPKATPEAKEAAFKDYIDQLVNAGVIKQPQADELMKMFSLDVMLHGGNAGEAAGAIGKELDAKAVPDGAPPSLSDDGKQLNARFGDYRITARTNEDGTKEVIIENTHTGEKTVVTPPIEGTLAFKLENGGEVRVNADENGEITGVAINADGKPGSDFSAEWGGDGKFCEPKTVSNWDKLPAPLSRLLERSGVQASADKGWTAEPGKDSKTDPKPEKERVTDLGKGLFSIDFDGDGTIDAIGQDKDGDGNYEAVFYRPEASKAS